MIFSLFPSLTYADSSKSSNVMTKRTLTEDSVEQSTKNKEKSTFKVDNVTDNNYMIYKGEWKTTGDPEASFSTFKSATNWINKTSDESPYTIYVTDDTSEITNAVIDSNKTVYLTSDNHTIYNGYSRHIIINGTMYMKDIKFNGNDKYGGVVVTDTFTMNTNSVIENCYRDESDYTSSDCGAGVRMEDDGEFNMNSNSKITDCYANYNGGGIDIGNGTVNMNDNSLISNCKADDSGGAISVSGGNLLNVNGGTIQNCQAYYGGGINGDVVFNKGFIKGCTAEEDGGAIYGEVTMNGGSIENCKASKGAGVRGHLFFNKGTIKDCKAEYAGGGIYGEVTMSGGSIFNCSAINGGGIYGKGTITAGSISNCIASNQGGAIYTDDYDYNDYIDFDNNYRNITISAIASFSSNSSKKKSGLPENYSSSFNFDGKLLNNNDINYVKDSVSEIVAFENGNDSNVYSGGNLSRAVDSITTEGTIYINEDITVLERIEIIRKDIKIISSGSTISTIDIYSHDYIFYVYDAALKLEKIILDGNAVGKGIESSNSKLIMNAILKSKTAKMILKGQQSICIQVSLL